MGHTTSPELGRRAETHALEFLRRQGLELVQRNYRWRGGELDLVMADGASLVVVEVRYRSSPEYGSPAESVDWRKRGKLTRTALHFLHSRPDLQELPLRFDVVALSPKGGELGIDWIRDAFEADGY